MGRPTVPRGPLTATLSSVAPSPTQLAWRRRIEGALRLVAPGLDLLLYAGDRLARAVDRDDAEAVLPTGPVTPLPSQRVVGAGPAADDR
jgi:hypothetical protein